MDLLESGLLGSMLVAGAIAVNVATRALVRENQRLARRIQRLEGVAGPWGMAPWLPRLVGALFLIPCVGYLVVPPFLAAVRLHGTEVPSPGLVRLGPLFARTIVYQDVPDPDPPATDCAPIAPGRLQDQLRAVAQRERLSPRLLEAVIYRESSFRPCAVSSSGAQGLMQLMPGTAADLGVRDPFDPEENIDGGARFLRQMLTRYQGNIPLALAAYHAGPGKVDGHATVPPIPKTQTYVSDIMKLASVEPIGTSGGL